MSPLRQWHQPDPGTGATRLGRLRRLPRWILPASLPLVIALGFVGGVLVSAYGPEIQPPSPPPASSQTPGDTEPDVPPSDSEPEPDTTTVLPGPPEYLVVSPLPGVLPRDFDEPLGLPEQGGAVGSEQPGPDAEPAPLEVRTLVDARKALLAEFSRYTSGGRELFGLDYQVARDANYRTILIGIVKIAQYDGWLKAVEEEPEKLLSWLRAAAERIKAAAEAENFRLVWTIFETVSDPPYGFLSKEVTPVPQGRGYVVTRPLAAVTDVSRSVVSLLPVDTSSTLPSTGGSPWSAYGPVIRFDPTDLYRPAPSTRP